VCEVEKETKVRDHGGKSRSGDDTHDATVDRELEQDRADSLGTRIEGADIPDRPPMEDQPEHCSVEDEAVDVERESHRADRVPFVHHSHQHEQHRNEPGILEDGCEGALTTSSCLTRICGPTFFISSSLGPMK